MAKINWIYAGIDLKFRHARKLTGYMLLFLVRARAGRRKKEKAGLAALGEPFLKREGFPRGAPPS